MLSECGGELNFYGVFINDQDKSFGKPVRSRISGQVFLYSIPLIKITGSSHWLDGHSGPFWV